MVSASDSQSGGRGFESSHLLDLFSVVQVKALDNPFK